VDGEQNSNKSELAKRARKVAKPEKVTKSEREKEADVVARLSALLFELNSEPISEPKSNIPESILSIDDRVEPILNHKASLILSSKRSLPDNQTSPLIAGAYTESQEQAALLKLQTILVDPGLEELATTVGLLATRIEQVESVVGDPRLSQKIDQLESQIADQSSQDQFQAQLQDLVQQQRNLPLEINRIDRQLTHLESNIFTPESLLELLLPIMGELLRRKVSLSQSEMCEALVPIVDLLIRRRTEQDHSSMSDAIAALLPDAISQAIHKFPAQTAKALAPEVALAIEAQIQLDHSAIAKALAPQIGSAIKQQILLERDAMVDALYPVIGSTISKYLSEALRLINQKVENAFSFEGVKRKFRAKFKGVSEAELILRESMPFQVRAIFLIHKNSGLIIADIQPKSTEQNEHLESDMIAGMLTAIRSFANDCLSQPGSELDQIEYGRSKILLEIAGYCYLAIVIDGTLTFSALKKIRRIFSDLLQTYGKQLAEFDGDSSTIPPEISFELEKLAIAIAPSSTKKNKSPNPLLIAGVLSSGAIAILWGFNQSQNDRATQLAQSSQKQIENTPELAIYNITSSVTRDRLTLSGKVPHLHLKQQAGAIALRATLPNQLNVQVENQIQVAIVPPDPVAIAAEVERNTKIWQKQPYSKIRVNYQNRQVTISGKIPTDDSQLLTQSFANIPGITNVTNTVAIAPPIISSEIYFKPGSAELTIAERPKLIEILRILQRYPKLQLQIVGYSDKTGEPSLNQRLARDRGLNIKSELQQLGIAPQRISSSPGRLFSTSNLNSQSVWRERSVKFRSYFPSTN
jgi:outer membrane protein OmpA-like peptidoglycan-associated protein